MKEEEIDKILDYNKILHVMVENDNSDYVFRGEKMADKVAEYLKPQIIELIKEEKKKAVSEVVEKIQEIIEEREKEWASIGITLNDELATIRQIKAVIAIIQGGGK